MKAMRVMALTAMMAVCGMASAHDFAVEINGQQVYFDVKNELKKTAILTYNGSIAQKQPTDYVGELNIPSIVKYKGKAYSIVGIGPKAFSGAEELTGVVMPMGVTEIGDFAFEGCTALEKIIFPGNQVKFGQGVFFRCDKIQDVSFGSDWKNVDLKMFRWSDSLTTVVIPAKMERVQNLKALKNLESVNVDVNNAKFSAVNGVLYNKNGEVLYGCPRAYKGNLKVVEGTKTITLGALIDCKDITRVDFPETLTSLSFRELNRMKQLREIIFRNEVPMMNAMIDGKEVLLLQVANADVKIIVPKSSKKVYKEALAQRTGEYIAVGGDTPYVVTADAMPLVKNIVGVKNFNKYE